MGNGGDITIIAKSFSMTDGAELQTVLREESGTIPGGRGKAGNVNITVEDAVTIAGNPTGATTAIFSEVNPGSVGNGGDINITAKSFSLSDGAILTARTLGQGDAGNIHIKASDSTTIAGALRLLAYFGLYTDTSTSGKGGDITVDTSTFRIADGAVFDARTTASGNGGKITVNTDTFEAASGGQLIATTTDSGNAGNITVNAIKGKVTISGSDATFNDRVYNFGQVDSVGRDVVANQGPGSGLFANTATNSTGAGGSIFLDSNKLTVKDGALVTVSSQGSGTAGDINAISRNVFLDKGAIVTEASSSEGGNIKLQVQDLLLMRNNSRISATAGLGGGGGDGGNIIIDAKNGFIVAFPFEDSNITANAFTGNGGKVDITAFGIYGLQFRKDDTRFSDITASSQFGRNGEVVLNTPDIELNRGLASLPEEPRSVEVAQGCQAGGRQASVKYFEIGRGGSPPKPDEPLTADTFVAEWIPVDFGKVGETGDRRQESGDRSQETGGGSAVGGFPDLRRLPFRRHKRLVPPCYAK